MTSFYKLSTGKEYSSNDFEKMAEARGLDVYELAHQMNAEELYQPDGLSELYEWADAALIERCNDERGSRHNKLTDRDAALLLEASHHAAYQHHAADYFYPFYTPDQLADELNEEGDLEEPYTAESIKNDNEWFCVVSSGIIMHVDGM